MSAAVVFDTVTAQNVVDFVNAPLTSSPTLNDDNIVDLVKASTDIVSDTVNASVI